MKDNKYMADIPEALKLNPLLTGALRDPAQSAKQQQADKVRAFLSNLQAERESKLGETSGVGDLLSLEQPMATLLGSLITGADKATRITDMPLYGAVVSPAVKKSRAAILKAALEGNRPKPRLDAVPEKLFDYAADTARRQRINEGGGTVPEVNEKFWNTRGKNLEILKEGEPHSGLSIRRPKTYPSTGKTQVSVDVMGRAPLKRWEEYVKGYEASMQARKLHESTEDLFQQQLKSLEDQNRWEEASKLIQSRYELPKRGFDIPDYPEMKLKADFDPTVVKPVSRLIAAKYPEANFIGGRRVTGIRTGKAGKGETDTSVPLPRLSDTQRLATLQQFEKWLHEKINTRAVPKTKTAGR